MPALAEHDFAVDGTAADLWPFGVEADRCVGVPADELDRAGHILGGRVGQVDPKQVHLEPVEPLDHPLIERRRPEGA